MEKKGIDISFKFGNDFVYSNIKSTHRKMKQRVAVKGIELTAALWCVKIWLIRLDFDHDYTPISYYEEEYKIIVLSVS